MGFLQNSGEIWRRLGLFQRVMLLALVGACGVAAALLVGWARKPEMALLYGGLEPQEAARIVEAARDAGVPYELKDGGTSVYVASDKVYSLRLDLAGQGLPTGGHEGYGILDKEKIGTSPFTQRINYRRAIEGELAKTIVLLEGVSAARVHIVQPEHKLFAKDDQGTSATVVLRLQPGWRLTPGNVAAIVHLVAGSVESCKPEEVVVVDSTGNLLSGEAGDGLARGAGTLLDYKTQVENYLARKAEDMLTMVLGPRRATVRVDAKIETSSVDQTVEKYDPEAKVATKEEIKSKSTPTGGAAGEGPAAGAAAKEETIVNDYLVGRTIEKTVNMPGKILSLSVAAFVDLSAPEPPAAAKETTGGAAPAAPAAPELTVAQVEEVIRSAIGLGPEDTLKVVAVPFRQPALPAPEVEEEKAFLSSPDFWMDLARHGSLGVLVIGALLVLKIFGGAKRKVAAEGGGQAAVAGAGAGSTMNLLAGGGASFDNPAELKGRITAALQENPDEVKRLFRAWVDGGKGEG